MSHASRISTAMAALLAIVVFSACQDAQLPTEVDTELTPQVEVTPGDVTYSQHQNRGGLLSGIDVTGTVRDLETGDLLGDFEGTLDITEFQLVDGVLMASGQLTGGLLNDLGEVVQEIVADFTTALDLSSTGPGRACRILELDIPGGLTLDVLGLVVDLAPVNLEVRAERGPGNLLGNLLCAVVGLLDLPAAIGAVLDLIDRINQLL
jgi:hypothetical protein